MATKLGKKVTYYEKLSTMQWGALFHNTAISLDYVVLQVT